MVSRMLNRFYKCITKQFPLGFLFEQSPPKSCTSVSKQESSKGSHRTGGQYRLPVKSHQRCYSWSDESLSMTQSGKTNNTELVFFVLHLNSSLISFVYPYVSIMLSFVAFVKAFCLPRLNHIISLLFIDNFFPYYTKYDKLFYSWVVNGQSFIHQTFVEFFFYVPDTAYVFP